MKTQTPQTTIDAADFVSFAVTTGIVNAILDHGDTANLKSLTDIGWSRTAAKAFLGGLRKAGGR